MNIVEIIKCSVISFERLLAIIGHCVLRFWRIQSTEGHRIVSDGFGIRKRLVVMLAEERESTLDSYAL